MKQQSFTDLEYANRKRKTKRDEFLAIMEEIVPWDELVAIVEPYYPNGKRGRPTRGIEVMLRMYLLQIWFNLSDEMVEDSIYDSYAFRNFMGIDFYSSSQVPDATTLCKFRSLLNENGITRMIHEATKEFLERHGKMMHGGSVMDATIIDAPTSTKNEMKQRDPEMHQVKKGNEWHFGERFHIGVDAGTGYVHSLEVTAANTSEISVAPELIREDDEVIYGDSAHTGIEKRKEIKGNPHLSKVTFRINTRKSYLKNPPAKENGINWDAYIEWQKSRVRSKVEYVFFVIKRIFKYNKVRYRGIKKNKTHAYALCAMANFYMLAKAGGVEVR